jgi:hypothetical protein
MRIAVLICSCHANERKRGAVRDTWVKRLTPDMPYYFYVGRGNDWKPDVVVFDVADGYNDLPPKTHMAITQAVNTIAFDWLIRLDDDTFLAPERLPGLIAEMESYGAAYFGSERCRDSRYATGGAGVVLSRKAAEIVAYSQRPPSCPESPDQDDGWIGLMLRQKGMKFYWTPRLHHDLAFRPRPDNDIVTGHYVLPGEMRTLYSALYA